MEMHKVVHYHNRVRNHYHPCCEQETLAKPHVGDNTKKRYSCPRGHTFETDSPIVVAVDHDPDYNTGPICSYCYVDWFKVNVNADEIVVEL